MSDEIRYLNPMSVLKSSELFMNFPAVVICVD